MSCLSDLKQLRQVLTPDDDVLYDGQLQTREEAFYPDATVQGDVAAAKPRREPAQYHSLPPSRTSPPAQVSPHRLPLGRLLLCGNPAIGGRVFTDDFSLFKRQDCWRSASKRDSHPQ